MKIMIALMYEVHVHERGMENVCLGIRMGDKDDVPKLRKALVRQVRSRYPTFFEGMKPREIENLCTFPIFEHEPDHNGFPRWFGYASDWDQ